MAHRECPPTALTGKPLWMVWDESGPTHRIREGSEMEDVPLLPGREIPLQPLRQAIESGEQHALGDVGLIELVAHFPLQLRGNDDAAMHGLSLRQETLERHGRVR